MKGTNYDIVYFIGIGGIGMSALARWFTSHNYTVAGYDKTATELTDTLEAEGIEIHFDDDPSLIPSTVFDNPDRALIIYTPAIPKDHKEMNLLQEKGYRLYKRSEVLGLITEDTFTIAVAGTHGKTTTTSMIAHIFKYCNYNITSLMGGISSNYESNFVVNQNTDQPEVFIVEADEYDRSFLTLNPDIAVVTSADADHLDIYGQKEDLQQGFKEFINKIRSSGQLILNEKILEMSDSAKQDISVVSYGLNRGQFFASNISIEDGFFIFDLYAENLMLKSLKLGVPGFYNVENAVAAIAAALRMDLPEESIKGAIQSYTGVKRRFEFIIRSEECVYVDDYAHHPEEISAFLHSLKEMYPKKKLTAIFQPHLYSRTRDFHIEFGQSLSIADEVILLDIYPARELPMEGVTSELIFNAIGHDNKRICSKEELSLLVKESNPEVVATIGAGDIDKLVEPIKKALSDE